MSKAPIFISYAHLDNQEFGIKNTKWVNFFHSRLKVALEERVGKKIDIWRDEKLQGNDEFDQTIMNHLMGASILISVLSNRYIGSDWCLRELESFLGQNEIRRVFRVVKTPLDLIDPRKLPPTVQRILEKQTGYPFYQLNPGTGKETSVPDVTTDMHFWQQLIDLAIDLADELRSEEKREGDQSSGKVVYLAQTTFDLRDQRDEIRRNLQQRGCLVLPDRDLPLIASELQNEVRQLLMRCELSIHLVGAPYGLVPEGADSSIAQMQYELAMERSEGLERLIWMPPELTPADQRQQVFITNLKNDPRMHRSVELLSNKLEDLKTRIDEKLRGVSTGTQKIETPHTHPKLYLMCDEKDLENAEPLTEFLFEQGLEVMIPATEGEQEEVIELHKENLRECDAAMIYFGRAADTWTRIMLKELTKSEGYGRSQPLRARAVYLDAPLTSPKKLFRTHDAMVIRGFEGVDPALLQPFLTQVLK